MYKQKNVKTLNQFEKQNEKKLCTVQAVLETAQIAEVKNELFKRL